MNIILYTQTLMPRAACVDQPHDTNNSHWQTLLHDRDMFQASCTSSDPTALNLKWPFCLCLSLKMLLLTWRYNDIKHIQTTFLHHNTDNISIGQSPPQRLCTLIYTVCTVYHAILNILCSVQSCKSHKYEIWKLLFFLSLGASGTFATEIVQCSSGMHTGHIVDQCKCNIR